MRRPTQVIAPQSALEARILPSGNVNVQMSNGVVHLTGDGSANTVIVFYVSGSGNLGIETPIGTKLNGVDNGYKTFSLPSSMIIDLKGGDDFLVLEGQLGGQVKILMGSGNDQVLGATAICTGAFSIDLGSGDDDLSLGGGLSVWRFSDDSREYR